MIIGHANTLVGECLGQKELWLDGSGIVVLKERAKPLGYEYTYEVLDLPSDGPSGGSLTFLNLLNSRLMGCFRTMVSKIKREFANPNK
ncbi:hypothetical protein [Pseudoalteromonas umbrosa]|uniref:hypothetical protein n=1 Tax=Pseudoalteromonas umbrosa TaxID=3048489 RepID=UPI0024C23E21|nr:hypothetical protein [Pseudoalteromonas sp. B95]MDK1286304.1 hypothetical protein [Pseudoalteromonas sp. B95]